MAERISRPEGIQKPSTTRSNLVQQALKARAANVRQQGSEALLQQWSERSVFNPLSRNNKFQTLKDRQQHSAKQDQKPSESQASKTTSEKSTDSKNSETVAKFFQKRNAEMDAQKLLTLNAQVVNAEHVEEVIQMVTEKFGDPSLADEALDYLLETLPPGSAAHKKALEAKKLLNARQARQIKAGHNMGELSRSLPGLADPNVLRELYRDITGNPREATTLFEELIAQFSYEKMCEAIEFILSALGSDMSAKGPSISRAELQVLMNEGRNMQAILGVYDFFKERDDLITNQFKDNDIRKSPRVSFEALSKQLVRLLKERYPSTAKVFALCAAMGIQRDIMAQIIIFTQFRDSMRGVSPRLFKNEKHRQDMLMTLIESLAELEDALDEEEEE